MSAFAGIHREATSVVKIQKRFYTSWETAVTMSFPKSPLLTASHTASTVGPWNPHDPATEGQSQYSRDPPPAMWPGPPVQRSVFVWRLVLQMFDSQLWAHTHLWIE